MNSNSTDLCENKCLSRGLVTIYEASFQFVFCSWMLDADFIRTALFVIGKIQGVAKMHLRFRRGPQLVTSFYGTVCLQSFRAALNYGMKCLSDSCTCAIGVLSRNLNLHQSLGNLKTGRG